MEIIRKDTDLVTYFSKMAKESFDSETLIYNKINPNPYGNVDTLYNELMKPDGFKRFQERLKIAIYGENAEWIQYLYDSRVIKNIVSTGSTKIRDLYKIQGFRGKQYLSVKQLRGKRGTILKTKLEDQFDRISKQMTNNFKKSLDKNIQNSPLFEQMISEIQTAISNGLRSHSFTVKMNDVDKKGRKIEKEENMQLFKISEEEDNNGLTYNVSANVKEILFRQDELVNIINDSTADIIKKYKKDLNVSYTTAESIFTKSLRFSFYNADVLGVDQKKASPEDMRIAQEFVKLNAHAIVQVFFDGIVQAVNSAHKDTKIEHIWDYEPQMVSLIQEDPHIASEIYKINMEAAASGTIGEVMFAHFLRIIKDNEESVKILGQEMTTTGSAAVDIKLERKLGEQIQRVGFQIKNYSSVGNEVVLYSQTNKFYDESQLIRYVEGGLLKHLYEVANRIFIERKMPADSTKAEGGDDFDEMENILAQCIPNYLRYDQADLASTNTFGKNNFYIINFNFVPASMLFYTLSKAIAAQENYIKQQNMFFFSGMSGVKSKHGLLKNSNSLSESWDGSWIKIREANKDQNGKYDLTPYVENGNEVPNIWRNNLYLNFKGVQIKFKDQLNFLWSNAKKG